MIFHQELFLLMVELEDKELDRVALVLAQVELAEMVVLEQLENYQ